MTTGHAVGRAAAGLALLALLAGCSGGGDGDSTAAAPAARPEASSSGSGPSVGPTAPGGSAAPGGSGSPVAPAGPAASSDPSSGIYGTVTPKQKEFIDKTVPKGIDPAAVLQAGQDTCVRLETARRADPDAVVSAIVTGEVKVASDVVTYLCPQLAPLLRTADRGVADGTFPVRAAAERNKAIAPGKYRTVADSTSCSWTVTSSTGAVLASGGGPGGSARRSTAVVGSGAGTFVSSGCIAWAPVS